MKCELFFLSEENISICNLPNHLISIFAKLVNVKQQVLALGKGTRWYNTSLKYIYTPVYQQ